MFKLLFPCVTLSQSEWRKFESWSNAAEHWPNMLKNESNNKQYVTDYLGDSLFLTLGSLSECLLFSLLRNLTFDFLGWLADSPVLPDCLPACLTDWLFTVPATLAKTLLTRWQQLHYIVLLGCDMTRSLDILSPTGESNAVRCAIFFH